jgi:magnesium transporter
VIPDPQARRPEVQALAYDAQRVQEWTSPEVAHLASERGQWPVLWVTVAGLGDARLIQDLGRAFGLHPLALEDVVNVHQRPKVEEYPGNLFIVLRMPRNTDRLETEQVSLFLGEQFVITFLEDPGDCYDPVRRRIHEGSGRIRTAGAGYLAYALIDATIDAYFPVVERYAERLDALEDAMGLNPQRHLLAALHAVKHDLRTIRRVFWPLRDEMNKLLRDLPGWFGAETSVFLRDCYDHTVQILDIVETYREIGADLSDLYQSSLSNRMNEVMKVLTIIATVFMPISFIAGVYGMNFNPAASPWNMPELNWYAGYPFALGLMAAVAAAMLFFFHRRGWLGSLSLPPRKDRE